MNKKFLLIFGIAASSLVAKADDLTTNLMLINSYNARQDKDIWARMRAGFRLQHQQTKLVEYYEKLYTRNPRSFAIMISNAKPFIYYILTETERNGMPSELALLPGVESTFNPSAKSGSNAYGMWQFLPGTGRRFNLEQNSDIDERQDVVKSTRSALAYLNYLHKIFGQWEPAIGAYNWGEGNMYKAVISSGQRPGNIDYATLDLRSETLSYVPKLIALASIIENPEKFGVDLNQMGNEPFFAIVNPVAPTSLNDMASQSGIDKVTFAKLNPQYRGNYMLSTTDGILLPLSNQSTYFAAMGKPIPNLAPATTPEVEMAATDSAPDEIANFAQTPASNDSTVSNVNAAPVVATAAITTTSVAAGTASAITTAALNTPPVESSNKLDDLIATIDTPNQPTNSTDPINYTVANGDTLYSIAKHFNANIDDIRQQNNIPGNDLTVGQTIIIKPNLPQVNG